MTCTYVNPSLPVHATPAPPHCVHPSILHVYVSISALQVGLYVPFSSFHIYALIYDIWFSLSDFTLYDKF